MSFSGDPGGLSDGHFPYLNLFFVTFSLFFLFLLKSFLFGVKCLLHRQHIALVVLYFRRKMVMVISKLLQNDFLHINSSRTCSE